MRDISLVQNTSCPQPSAQPQGQKEVNAGNLTDSAFPADSQSKNLWTLKAPGNASSGPVSSDEMTACTDPCLSFWCLSLFILPSSYTSPSSCPPAHLSLCFTLPHLLILSFLLSLKQARTNRLQLQ